MADATIGGSVRGRSVDRFGIPESVLVIVMSRLGSVPLLLVSLSSPRAVTEWPPRQHSVGAVAMVGQGFTLNAPRRSPHDAIPNCRADLPLCERDIRPF